MQPQHPTRNARFEVLLSPGFAISLMLLIINDHALKGAYPGWLTGKLSDFAGLFMFSLFCMTLIPNKLRRTNLTIAIAFTLWKSPLSETFIMLWNLLPVYDVSRVVDYTDLIALSVLPLSAWYFRRVPDVPVRKAVVYPVLMISCLAVMATSPPRYQSEAAFQLEALDNSQHVKPDPLMAINSIASLHGLPLRDLEASNYNMYDDGSITLWAKLDPGKNLLYIYVSEASYSKEELKQFRQIADRIIEEIKSSMGGAYQVIDSRGPAEFIKFSTDTVTLRIKPSGLKLSLPNKSSGCDREHPQVSEIMRAFELVDSYFEKKGSGKIEYITDDPCKTEHLGIYLIGNVLGPITYDTSAQAEVIYSSGLLSSSLFVTFSEHIYNREINTLEVAEELRETLKKSLDPSTVIHIDGSSVNDKHLEP